MTEDFGDKTDAYLYADASAAIGVAGREGLGRIRHLDTQSLWLQQALRQRRLGLSKVLGTENPSDLMTKHVDAKLLGEHVRSMGCEFEDGRAELAPQVVKNVEDSEDGRIEDTVNLAEDDYDELASEGCATNDEDEDEIASEGCTITGSPRGLMTAAARSNGSTAQPNPLRNRHRTVCTTSSAGSLTSMKLYGRRWGMGKYAQSPWDDQLCRPSLLRDNAGKMSGEISCTGPGEHLRGHPCHFLLLPQRHSRSRGGACFVSACPCRLIICHARTLIGAMQSRTYDVCTYAAFSLDAFWAQA